MSDSPDWAQATVSQYLRIPASQHQMIDEIARHLRIPMRRVINAMFRFLLQTATERGAIIQLVRFARQGIGVTTDEIRRGVVLVDFDASGFDKRRTHYATLETMGLIEDLQCKTSQGGRGICAFRVTEMGRVMAEVFRRTGLSSEITPDEHERVRNANAHQEETA